MSARHNTTRRSTAMIAAIVGLLVSMASVASGAGAAVTDSAEPPVRDERPAERSSEPTSSEDAGSSDASLGGLWTDAEVAQRIEADLALRSALGFPSDRTQVEDVYASRQRLNRDFGAVFSTAETQELEIRGELSLDAQTANDWAASTKAPFGGAFIDNARGGLLILRLCSTYTGPSIEPARHLLHPERLSIEGCDYTLHDLEETEARVEKDRGLLGALGVDVAAHYVDIVTNRVVIAAVDPDAHDRAIVAIRYGSQVRVAPGGKMEPSAGPEPGRLNDPAPHAAGIAIRSPPPNLPGEGFCTLGFAIRLANGDEGSLSAGHCGVPGDVWGNGPQYDTVGGHRIDRIFR